MPPPWSSETNWTVSRGSLHSVVTFESFDSTIDSESTSPKPKPPLLLLPPSSSHIEHCEIKLNFTRKHEIRQVYVRSTARIYEIYYAPALQNDTEYLCTVRCSVASVDDNSFPETDGKDAGPGDILPKAKMAGENKIGTNEDDWVEVKHPLGLVDVGNASLPKQNSIDRLNYQNFYEATAEINDSEPCMSLTIRLLSLQTKGCVYVDEVYVFADAIDSIDTENQTVNAETSTGNSLMTMLVPTLLGLTKSRSAQLENQNSPNPVRKPTKTELESITSTQPVNLVHQQDVNTRKPNETTAELALSQACDCTMRNEFPSNRAEILLEQLVARVSRIENIFMRFEENMLKPINKMEARLEHVEQQVELLGRCTVSPSFSRLEPDPISVSSDRSDEPVLQKTETFSTETYIPLEDAYAATVHEVPTEEQVEVHDVLESPKKERLKKPVSIDDALAAALAGFSSITKTESSTTVELHGKESLNHNQGSIDTTLGSDNVEVDTSVSCEPVKETAPDFIKEENGCPAEGLDTSFHSQEEDAGTTSSPDETDAQQESIEPVKMLTFDKTDILKYFPNQPPDMSEPRVDFESPILEVKFASFENESHRSPLEALLTSSNEPATDERVSVEERAETANGLLVDLDDDDVSEEAPGDTTAITSFASLI